MKNSDKKKALNFSDQQGYFGHYLSNQKKNKEVKPL